MSKKGLWAWCVALHRSRLFGFSGPWPFRVLERRRKQAASAIVCSPPRVKSNSLPSGRRRSSTAFFYDPFTTRTWAAHLSSQLREPSADIAPCNGRPTHGKGKVESKYVKFCGYIPFISLFVPCCKCPLTPRKPGCILRLMWSEIPSPVYFTLLRPLRTSRGP